MNSVIYEVGAHQQKSLMHVFESDSDEKILIEITLHAHAYSQLTFVPVIMGNASYSITLKAILEDHAHVTISGVYALNGNQQCSLSTLQHHRGKNSTSTLVINGVAAHASHIDYRGLITIEREAAGTVARQENKTIVMGDRSRATSVPSIEVMTHEVACAHGSAVGPLDEQQIRYVQARGLPYETAQRLILGSFFAGPLALCHAQTKEFIPLLVNRVFESGAAL